MYISSLLYKFYDVNNIFVMYLYFLTFCESWKKYMTKLRDMCKSLSCIGLSTTVQVC